MPEVIPKPTNDLDALMYFTDCMLATVEEYVERKTISARTFERHVEIAEKAIDFIQQRIYVLTSIQTQNNSVVPWYHGYRYFNNTRVETVCSDFHYNVRAWIVYLRSPK